MSGVLINLVSAQNHLYEDSMFIIDKVYKDNIGNRTIFENPEIIVNTHTINRHISIIKKVLKITRADTNYCKIIKLNMNPSFLDITLFGKTDTVYRGSNFDFKISEKNQIIRCLIPEVCTIDKNNNIDKQNAMTIAQNFFKAFLEIYGIGNEITDYDSISIKTINNGGTTNYYCIEFRCKGKNDIFDTRYATIELSEITGEIHWYRGNIYRDYNPSYIPKIKKDEIIKLINDKYENIRNGKLHIKEMFLSERPLDTGKRWIWFVSLDGIKDAEGFSGDYIEIDSETGKVYAITENLKE